MSTSLSPRTPLAHPLWWAALIVLFANDHFGKGGGLLPPFVTGKLSDFAFLIVAPVLLAALLPAQLPHRRPLAFVLVVGLFTFGNLSTLVSDQIVAAVGMFGIRWRLWPDAADLIALAIVPLAWWLSKQPIREVAITRPLKIAGLVAGTLVCAATSPPPSYRHQPFLINRTAAPANVTVTWLLRKIDCSGAFATRAATFTANDFDDPRSFTLLPGAVAALDQPPLLTTSPAGRCSNRPGFRGGETERYGISDEPCIAGLVQVDGGPSVLFRARSAWDEDDSGLFGEDEDATRSKCRPTLPLDADPGHGALSVMGSPASPTFVSGPRMEFVSTTRAEIDARPGVAGCRQLREQIQRDVAAVQTCETDADCGTADGVPLPGAGTLCHVYVNRTIGKSHFAGAATSWRSTCMPDRSDMSCTKPQPAVCRAGRCEATCQGIVLPACVSACETTAPAEGERCSSSRGDCMRGEKRCSCEDGVFQCQTTVVACPLTCLER